MKRAKPFGRTRHVPTIYQMRSAAMQAARRTHDADRRAAFVGMARHVNHVLVQSDTRRRVCLAEFRAVLETLN